MQAGRCRTPLQLALSSLAHADWISSKRPQRAIVLMAAAVVGPAASANKCIKEQHVLALNAVGKRNHPTENTLTVLTIRSGTLVALFRGPFLTQ